MAVLSLPLSFSNSFWTSDYRKGLEVLYSKLEQVRVTVHVSRNHKAHSRCLSGRLREQRTCRFHPGEDQHPTRSYSLSTYSFFDRPERRPRRTLAPLSQLLYPRSQVCLPTSSRRIVFEIFVLGPGFSADDGATLLMAFRGLQAETAEQGGAHKAIARELQQLVADPFEKWAKVYHVRHNDSHTSPYVYGLP
jgi:hypothetical protein